MFHRMEIRANAANVAGKDGERVEKCSRTPCRFVAWSEVWSWNIQRHYNNLKYHYICVYMSIMCVQCGANSKLRHN